jgi:hypothetical protein
VSYAQIRCPRPPSGYVSGHRVGKGFDDIYICNRCGERQFRVRIKRSLFWGRYVIEEEP